MEKEFMLLLIKERIEILRSRIKDTVSMTGYNKQSTAQYDRTKYTQETNLLLLLEELIIHYPFKTIDDDNMIKGFERLTKPMERHRRLR